MLFFFKKERKKKGKEEQEKKLDLEPVISEEFSVSFIGFWQEKSSILLYWNKYFFKFILYWSKVYNAVLVSGVQQNDSVIHTYIHIHYSSDFFPYRLLQNIE